MLWASENAELFEHLTSETVLREHSFDGMLDDELRITGALLSEGAVAFATNVAGEEHIFLLLVLLTGDDELLRVDYDDVVAGVDVWCVSGFMATAQYVGDLYRHAAKNLPLGIDNMPLGLHCFLFGEECFHGKRV